MGMTDRYRVQHRELIALAGEIRTKLRRDSLPAEAASGRELLSTFASILSLHLAMEDKALYPQLQADPKTAEIAHRYQRDMGGLAALSKRIERENNGLYAAADG